MIWKSSATALEQVERARRPLVVERHERIVEDQRRPPVAGHEPDEAEPGREIDEVERALAERRDRHPVAALGRVDVDVERLVVDPDAPIAAAGHRRDVADHVALEVAGRGLHRRGLGALDGAAASSSSTRWRRWSIDELLAPAGQPLGLGRRPARHRRCCARPGRGRWPRRRGRARARASWSRTSTSSRSRARGSLAIGPSASMALVFCSISRAAASRIVGSVSRGSLPTRPSSWAVSWSIRATCASSRGQQVLRRRQVLEPERAELLLGVRLGLRELRLHLRAAAQASVDLDVAHLGSASSSSAAATCATTARIRPIPATAPPRNSGTVPRSSEPERLSTNAATATSTPSTTASEADPRQRSPGRARARPRTGRRSRRRARPCSSRIRASSAAQPLDGLARSPAAGSARDASGPARRARSRPRRPRGTARSARGPRSVRASSRSAWRAFSSRLRRSARLRLRIAPGARGRPTACRDRARAGPGAARPARRPVRSRRPRPRPP